MSDSLELILPGGLPDNANSRAIRAIGIDLGTTNSTVAEVVWNSRTRKPEARCIEVEQKTLDSSYSNVTVPSVVAIYKKNIYIGEGAKRIRYKMQELKLSRNKEVFYECKNEIGIKRTYHRAPTGFESAAAIGGRVLSFLRDAAQKANNIPIQNTVITVPASFQLAQRIDTIEAASRAGISLEPGDLLDEPIAAFLDYLVSVKEIPQIMGNYSLNILIFDFGGGTCDIAIFRLENSNCKEPLKVSPLAVSRYYRLGGCDIDTAIVYEVLLPKIISENRLGKFDLSFEDKKQLEPAILGIAEALKIKLCSQISRLRSFGKYTDSHKMELKVQSPESYVFNLRSQQLTLSNPTLTAKQFETLLEPFLDEDLLYSRETEYRLTNSIFSPIEDALDRSGLSRSDIDLCLTVGGSSLIPQVYDAMDQHFKDAKIITYEDPEQMLTAIARGAAYHSFAKALTGRGLVETVTHESLAIRTSTGTMEIIPKGVHLPYPGSGLPGKFEGLEVPEISVLEPLFLRIEILSGSDNRILFSKLWEITGAVGSGEPLSLEYLYDENQALDLKIYLTNDPNKVPFSATIENPLTNVVNPDINRLRADELEESIRTGKFSTTEVLDKYLDLGDLYWEMGQKEKGIEFVKKVLKNKGADTFLLNKLALLSGEIGDITRQIKYYKEAANESPNWGGPLFNLALAYDKQGETEKALKAIESALKIQPSSGPYLVFRSQLAEKENDLICRNEKLQMAINCFGPIMSLSDWELSWYITATKMAANNEKEREAQMEKVRRARTQKHSCEQSGYLPVFKGGLVRGD